MSTRDYDAAIELIDDSQELSDFAGPRDESLISAAETALGVQYPEPYRWFLRSYGAGSFGSIEIMGVISRSWEDSSVPDGVWYTLNERRESSLSTNFVVIGEDGGGGLYLLNCEDGAVYVTASDDPERLAESFGAFLLEQVTSEIE
ncbi:MAG: SMI1/KNR4 family protein [Planctomycetota bacterium]